jgi:uncharacterized protein (DUF2267 family)
MDYDSFLDVVATEGHLPREDAERAVRAVLETLAERIDREEARQLAAQLPPEVAPWIATMTPAAGFDADELLRRVAEREGTDLRRARRDVPAVLDALSRAVSRDEWDDMVAELPQSFAPLLPRGPWIEVPEPDGLLDAVAERAGLDRAGARRATEAVLETLAERIAGGEVDDLIARLPTELHPPLERGRAASGGQATRMALDAFLHRIAEREGVADREATEHARAVVHTLHDAVGDQEFLDITAELPADYVRTLAR